MLNLNPLCFACLALAFTLYAGFLSLLWVALGGAILHDWDTLIRVLDGLWDIFIRFWWQIRPSNFQNLYLLSQPRLCLHLFCLCFPLPLSPIFQHLSLHLTSPLPSINESIQLYLFWTSIHSQFIASLLVLMSRARLVSDMFMITLFLTFSSSVHLTSFIPFTMAAYLLAYLY